MKNCEKYRAGNFLFVKEKRGGMNYITCSTLTREWHIRLSETILVYAVVESLIGAKEFEKLASLATLWYAHSVMMHSAEYYAAVSKALVDDVNRAEAPEIAKEDDDAIIDKVADYESKVDELNAIVNG